MALHRRNACAPAGLADVCDRALQKLAKIRTTACNGKSKCCVSDFRTMVEMRAESADDQDMTLRVWDGDEAVLGELVMKHYGAIRSFIQRSYPRLRDEDVEDIVSEGIWRFWSCRQRYDGKRPLGPWLCKFAINVAMEFVARRFKWQKARQLEVHVDFPIESAAAKETEDKLDRVETQNPKLLSEIQRVIAKLPPLQRDIWYAYAFAGNLTPDAGALGVELGMKYENGVPIPAGTIRVYKSRAIGTVKAEMKKLGYDLDRLEGRS